MTRAKAHDLVCRPCQWLVRFNLITPMARTCRPTHTDRMKGRWIGVGAAIAVVLLLGLGVHVYVSAYGTGSSDAERIAALKAAHQVQATVHGAFLVATYRPNAGSHEPSNTGHACFGRTVLVRLVWNGANFSHGAGMVGRANERHQALVVTADATSGVPCLIGASYGSAAADPKPGEQYLYGPRKDLVPTQ